MEPPESPRIDLTGRKIMVVDDERLNIRILTTILKQERFDAIEAHSGEQALEIYPQVLPDLILLDVMMPGINGFETCRRLRQQYGEKAAPIIFITAKNESDDVVEGLNAGGVDYLPKPVRAKEAVARIRTHLQNRILIEQQTSLVAQLSKANAAKNKFLGMAAHDLRNPLASIRGLAELMQEGVAGPLSPDQADLVQTIHDASQGMLELVNELLDVATIEAGELKIHAEPTNLGELITKAVYLANIDAAKKGTRLTFQPPAAVRPQSLDAAKIRQVINNLLSNGVKYSPPNSVITVSFTQEQEGRSSFAVRDQGPGIPDNERDRLFLDFSRLSTKPTGGEKSTGLGLAICRKIIEAHHGSISAENMPSGGCEFRVTLPA